MPRDSNGNYALPAGNPVVTGAVIDSNWANDTMQDIAAELQDSLSRSGNGGMQAPFLFTGGSTAAPSIAFTAEPSLGIYRSGSADMRMVAGGGPRARIRSDTNNPFQFFTGGDWRNPTASNRAETIAASWAFTSTGTTVPEATVKAHESALEITTSQITDWAGGGGGGLENIVEDTTPQLGGNLDMNGFNVGGISQSNLCSKAASATISGSWTFTGIATLDANVATSGFGTGGRVKDGQDVSRPVGFNVVPIFERDTDYTLAMSRNGYMLHRDTSSEVDYTCNTDTTTPNGAIYMVSNEAGGVCRVRQGTATLRWFTGSGTQTGNRLVANGGIATVYKYANGEYWIWGIGIS